MSCGIAAQPRQQDDGRQRQRAPDMHEEHRKLRQIGFAEIEHVLARSPMRSRTEQSDPAQKRVDRAIDAVQHPEPADGRQRDRRGPRQQNEEPHQPLAMKIGRKHQRQNVRQHQHDRLRDEGKVEGVPERSLEGAVVPDRTEILQPHPVDALIADRHIAEGIGNRQHEGNRHQSDDVEHRRQQHQRAEQARAVEQIAPLRRRLVVRPFDRRLRRRRAHAGASVRNPVARSKYFKSPSETLNSSGVPMASSWWKVAGKRATTLSPATSP